jgi:hypothetical protein
MPEDVVERAVLEENDDEMVDCACRGARVRYDDLPSS